MNQEPPKGDFERRSVRDRSKGRRRLLAAAVSVASHLAILAALLSARSDPPKTVEDRSITVALVDEPLLPPKAPAAAAPKPTPPKPAPPKPKPPRPAARRTPFRKSPAPREEDSPEAGDVGMELSDAELAGAASADAGPPGGACNMAGRVQAALRKDPLVLAAVAKTSGKAMRVWNGDWVRGGGEDGKGLAAVREAIMWEVAFAPAACRSQPVRGLVLLSLNGYAGPARLAVGSGEWRWSDLLRAR
jgi:hypothetical protein